MSLKSLYAAVVAVCTAASVRAEGSPQLAFGPPAFTPSGLFPTKVYSKYFNDPTATAAQPQPVIFDPVLKKTFPSDLTNPKTIPKNDTTDPLPLPPPVPPQTLFNTAVTQIKSIANNAVFEGNTCAQCLASLEVLKLVALTQPNIMPELIVTICDDFDFSGNCGDSFGPFTDGPIITQVLANADVGGYDGQMICNNFASKCPLPPMPPLDLTGWFAKPKPNPLPPPRKPSGERLKVLHLSDFHLDPRYTIGAEADCSSGLCCRPNVFNRASPNTTVLPAPRYGSFLCDTPQYLALAALQSIPVLTDTEHTPFDFMIYTGDLVSHDSDNQLSREYVEYEETITYTLFKDILNVGPVYVTLGNHDSWPQAQDAPHNLGGELANQFSWNYDHVAGLWAINNWLPGSSVEQAKATYGAYSVRRADGLRIITLNTDFWYHSNWFNFINLAGADNSGMLRFLADELQDAEDAHDRVWILGHVLPGWDGTNGLQTPTNLFYQIVDRFSPHVIANTFFGHSHEDELSIFYTNNGTDQTAENAVALSWVTPSITPLTNLNSGFRVYEVDSSTFEVLDAITWFSNVSEFPALDNQTKHGAPFKLEYNTRDAYGQNIKGFGPNDPLNATWWHLVTEQMNSTDNGPALVSLFNTHQGKSSVKTPPCTGDCAMAKICYMRSGSVPLAFANCQAGFGSVQ